MLTVVFVVTKQYPALKEAKEISIPAIGIFLGEQHKYGLSQSFRMFLAL